MTNGALMFIIDLFSLFRKARRRFATLAFASVGLKYTKNFACSPGKRFAVRNIEICFNLTERFKNRFDKRLNLLYFISLNRRNFMAAVGIV